MVHKTRSLLPLSTWCTWGTAVNVFEIAMVSLNFCYKLSENIVSYNYFVWTQIVEERSIQEPKC